MSRILFFDLETRYSADEVGGWGNVMDMGMSVGVIWDSHDEQFHVYLENQVPALMVHLTSGKTLGHVIAYICAGGIRRYLEPRLIRNQTIDRRVQNLTAEIPQGARRNCTIS